MKTSSQRPRSSARPARTRDARGRPVSFLDPYELNLLRRYEVIPAETLQFIADKVSFGLPKWQRRGYLACVFTFLACVVFLLRLLPTDPADGATVCPECGCAWKLEDAQIDRAAPEEILTD